MYPVSPLNNYHSRFRVPPQQTFFQSNQLNNSHNNNNNNNTNSNSGSNLHGSSYAFGSNSSANNNSNHSNSESNVGSSNNTFKSNNNNNNNNNNMPTSSGFNGYNNDSKENDTLIGTYDDDTLRFTWNTPTVMFNTDKLPSHIYFLHSKPEFRGNYVQTGACKYEFVKTRSQFKRKRDSYQSSKQKEIDANALAKGRDFLYNTLKLSEYQHDGGYIIAHGCHITLEHPLRTFCLCRKSGEQSCNSHDTKWDLCEQYLFNLYKSESQSHTKLFNCQELQDGHMHDEFGWVVNSLWKYDRNCNAKLEKFPLFISFTLDGGNPKMGLYSGGGGYTPVKEKDNFLDGNESLDNWIVRDRQMEYLCHLFQLWRSMHDGRKTEEMLDGITPFHLLALDNDDLFDGKFYLADNHGNSRHNNICLIHGKIKDLNHTQCTTDCSRQYLEERGFFLTQFYTKYFVNKKSFQLSKLCKKGIFGTTYNQNMINNNNNNNNNYYGNNSENKENDEKQNIISSVFRTINKNFQIEVNNNCSITYYNISFFRCALCDFTYNGHCQHSNVSPNGYKTGIEGSLSEDGLKQYGYIAPYFGTASFCKRYARNKYEITDCVSTYLSDCVQYHVNNDVILKNLQNKINKVCSFDDKERFSHFLYVFYDDDEIHCLFYAYVRAFQREFRREIEFIYGKLVLGHCRICEIMKKILNSNEKQQFIKAHWNCRAKILSLSSIYNKSCDHVSTYSNYQRYLRGNCACSHNNNGSSFGIPDTDNDASFNGEFNDSMNNNNNNSNNWYNYGNSEWNQNGTLLPKQHESKSNGNGNGNGNGNNDQSQSSFSNMFENAFSSPFTTHKTNNPFGNSLGFESQNSFAANGFGGFGTSNNSNNSNNGVFNDGMNNNTNSNNNGGFGSNSGAFSKSGSSFGDQSENGYGGFGSAKNDGGSDGTMNNRNNTSNNGNNGNNDNRNGYGGFSSLFGDQSANSFGGFGSANDGGFDGTSNQSNLNNNGNNDNNGFGGFGSNSGGFGSFLKDSNNDNNTNWNGSFNGFSFDNNDNFDDNRDDDHEMNRPFGNET